MQSQNRLVRRQEQSVAGSARQKVDPRIGLTLIRLKAQGKLAEIDVDAGAVRSNIRSGQDFRDGLRSGPETPIATPKHLSAVPNPPKQQQPEATAGQGYILFPTPGNSMSLAPPNIPIHGEEERRHTGSTRLRARQAACVLVTRIRAKIK